MQVVRRGRPDEVVVGAEVVVAGRALDQRPVEDLAHDVGPGGADVAQDPRAVPRGGRRERAGRDDADEATAAAPEFAAEAS